MMNTISGLAADAQLRPALARQPNTQCRTCALRGSYLCRSIQTEALSGSRPPVVRRFGRGKRIVAQGETSGFFGEVRRGFARKTTLRTSGKRILMGLAIPGDVIVGLPGQRNDHDYEAATDTELCLYDTAMIKRLMEFNQPFRRLLLTELDHQHHRLLGQLWRNGTLNSRERIIAFLVKATGCMPTEPLPDGSLVLTMEIDRRDWADLTNAAVETISRTLRYLDEKGLVTSLSPYRFRIRDPRVLAAISGVDMPTRPAEAREHSQRDKIAVWAQRNPTGK
jgi:CRP-like cAMP-binding protein